MRPDVKPDIKRHHFLGAYEWRLLPDYFERMDRRGYRRLFDRVFYDEIRSLTVFRVPDLALFVRAALFAFATAPALLLLRLAARDWKLPLLVTGGYLALFLSSAALLGFGRGKTVMLFDTLYGAREIVFNRSAASTGALVSRVVSLIRAAQATMPVKIEE